MSKELEYIQRHIDIVKQQIKGSKIKFTVTDAITKHQYDYYENELQTLESIEKSLHRLESIDNAEPSEALKCFENMQSRIACYISTIEYATIKQALLKKQELPEPFKTGVDIGVIKPKQYLKWENLEFDNNASVKKHIKVKLGDNIYKAYYHFCFLLNSELFCIENANENLNIYITNKQFFNDLRLERVEE